MEVQEKEGLIVRDKMFVSYSHDDEKWRDMLLTAIYSHFGQDPPIWYYAENAEFSDDIEGRDSEGKVRNKSGILLTSNNYFASSVIMRLEYPYFKEQRVRKNLRILWIPCAPSSADMQGLRNVWTPVGIDPLTRKNEDGQLNAFDVAARQLWEYMNQSTETVD